MVKRIADAKADREHWLATRKGYLTSSDFYSWLGDTPHWWSDTRESVLAGKLSDDGKEFPLPVQVSIEHGSYDEENILAKFGHAVGATTTADNGFYVNERWPALAASIDGFCGPASSPRAPHPEFCQDPDRLHEIAADMHESFDMYICEIKKSTSAGWQKKVSEWYMPQVQGQLWILDYECAIIVAETVTYIQPEGEKRKRLFWDLRPHIIPRDPAFQFKMDRMNEEFLNER